MFAGLQPTFLISLLIAFTVHEWSHAVVATRLGDPTPHNEGRLTLNPLAHLDPMGTLMFLVAHFGWAKPVPINPMYFRNRKLGVFLVALAGPFSNLILATLAYIVLHAVSVQASAGGVWGLLGVQGGSTVMDGFVVPLLATSLFVNLGLMAFNLIPIGPLDGSKVLQLIVPYDFEDQYEQYLSYGQYILIGLLIADNFLGLNFISNWIGFLMEGVLRGLQLIFG
jgi:Zn-dependent protease